MMEIRILSLYYRLYWNCERGPLFNIVPAIKIVAKFSTLLADRRYGFVATHPPTVSYVVIRRNLRWEGRSLRDGEGNSRKAPLSARVTRDSPRGDC